MYQIGEYIIYGVNGVCKIKEIGSVNIGSHRSDQIFYTLEPVFNSGSTVYIPVDSNKVSTRQLISTEEAEKLIDEIPDIEFIWVTNDKEREKKLKEAIHTHDCRECVKVIKTLSKRKRERIAAGKKITITDEKYLHAAEENLYNELSIVLEIPKTEVEGYILKRVGNRESK